MSRELDKLRNALIERDDDNRQLAWPVSKPSEFFTFRYSSTEIFSQGDHLHVKMKETRYQDGHFKSEECEGTLDRQAYDRMVGEAQAFFLNQAVGFARLLLAPFMARGRRWDE